MKKITSLTLISALILASSTAMAWESANGVHSTSASVALASDYVWRGYSQTDEQMAISGSFDYGHSSGLYAGTWASNVDFGDDTSIEVDVYAGYANETAGGLGYDVMALRYIYPGEDYSWNEVSLGLSYSYFSVGVAHSGDVYGSGETGTYYSAGFDYDLPVAGLALSTGVGFYDYDDDVSDDDHTDYRIGLSKDVAGFGMDLTYYGMDSDGKDAYGDLADSRIVFTISGSM